MGDTMKWNKSFANPDNMYYYSFIGFCLIIIDTLEPAIWQSQSKKFIPQHCKAFIQDYTFARKGNNPYLVVWIFMNQYRNGFLVAFNAVHRIMLGHPSTMTTSTTTTT